MSSSDITYSLGVFHGWEKLKRCDVQRICNTLGVARYMRADTKNKKFG